MCSYHPGNPSLKYKERKIGHVINATKENKQGGLEKNKPVQGQSGQEYIVNNIKNNHYSKKSVTFQGCIDSGRRCLRHGNSTCPTWYMYTQILKHEDRKSVVFQDLRVLARS